jgi:hypothetical protein
MLGQILAYHVSESAEFERIYSDTLRKLEKVVSSCNQVQILGEMGKEIVLLLTMALRVEVFA